MSIGTMLGSFFFFFLFLFGMILSRKESIFFIVGIIGLIGTIYFVIRIVSFILKEMHKRNTN